MTQRCSDDIIKQLCRRPAADVLPAGACKERRGTPDAELQTKEADGKRCESGTALYQTLGNRTGAETEEERTV